ncbi:transposase [Oligoflexus sp.]|uniref:transposase n=1 Tax=Oligoflexus sp. TaxID=1971216 RepID=UPI002D783D3A|nr:transposase [Oligoflexus sp.]
MQKKGSKTKALVIFDATLTGRRGKHVENISFHKLGKKTVRGHKIVNFVLVLGEDVIPLSAVAHYSQGYCEENGFTYKTENELVIDWLNWLHASDLFPREIIKHLHFVCDAGYDAKKVQKAINRIGCHFTMCIKCKRQIDGMAIDEYFRRQRIIPWQSIRLFARKDGKMVRKEYRIRIAAEVKLKGFGLVTAVYSEMKRRDGKKSSKYIVSSDPCMSGGEIVETYKRRWAVETWHKEMKQEHGFGDCQSSSFRAVETHINFCLAAYNLQRCHDPGLPKPGTTVTEYATVYKIKEASLYLNQFNGVSRFKKAANEALAAITQGEAA